MTGKKNKRSYTTIVNLDDYSAKLVDAEAKRRAKLAGVPVTRAAVVRSIIAKVLATS